MSGDTLFHEGADLMSMVDGEPGLVAICAPPGTVSALRAAPFARKNGSLTAAAAQCMLTDTRMLHCGGQRTAPGSRYAMRIHYNRYLPRQISL